MLTAFEQIAQKKIKYLHSQNLDLDRYRIVPGGQVFSGKLFNLIKFLMLGLAECRCQKHWGK